MDYNNDYNDNDNDDDQSTIINLRLSDISIETEKLISDIIFQEVESNTKGCPRPSVTLTRLEEEEHENGNEEGDGGPSSSNSSSRNRNSNKQRRSSILSMRTSIMSQDTADQILKSFLEISSNNNSNSNSNSNSNEQHQLQQPMVTSSSSSSFAAEHSSIHSRMSRLSIAVVDPSIFGDGGTPIIYDNNKRNKNSNMTPENDIISNNSSRYSISRDTLELFDKPFDQKTFFDNFDENYDDDEEHEQEMIKPIEVVSAETSHEFNIGTKETQKIHEDVLAAEIEKLSFDHKQKFIFDVHGMSSMMNDSSNGIHNSRANGTSDNNEMIMLQQLEEELTEEKLYQNNNESGNTSTLDHDNGYAFREAQKINPDYANSKEFRLTFLNAWMFYVDKNGKEDYVKEVAKEAARNIALNFYVKKDLFGNGEILGRDVKLTDLNDDDREAMDSGVMQIMQNRDAAGRLVVVYAPGEYSYKKLENWLRAKWYISSIIWKDQDCNNSKFGIVWINHLRGFIEQRESYETIKKITLATVSFPIVCKAYHWCYNDESMKALVAAKMVHFLHKYGRGRFLDHYIPDYDELCFRLETFGIPIDKNDFLPNGHLGLDWYEEWIKSRESLEANQKESNDYLSNDTDTTITIRKLDVLFGRGKMSRKHVGNLRCGLLVESHLQEYNTATKFAKTQ